MDCRTALATILDSVDYTAGNCRPNEMVGAVLPKEMIVMARQSIAEFDKFFEMGMKAANEVYEKYSGNLTPDAADASRMEEWEVDPRRNGTAKLLDGYCPECGSKLKEDGHCPGEVLKFHPKQRR